MNKKVSTALCFTFLALVTEGLLPSEDPNLFEGDIVLDPGQREAINTGTNSYAATKGKLWPHNIPYEFSAELQANSKIQKGFHEAVEHYKNHTCLRFIKRQPYHRQYLYFYNGYGCSSHIGPNGGVRKVSLDPEKGCYKRDVIVHEVMHAIGFWHEQSRPDRDQYVKIVWENIPIDARSNFKKYGRDQIESLGVPYDLRSIMHYTQSAFTSNNRYSIKTVDPKLQYLLKGDRNNIGFSELDIKQIRLLYKCDGNNPVTGQPTMPSCADYLDYCQRYKQYCTKPKTDVLRKWVDEQCRKTCGLCV